MAIIQKWLFLVICLLFVVCLLFVCVRFQTNKGSNNHEIKMACLLVARAPGSIAPHPTMAAGSGE
jgi:ABC-type uncharacterized transport system permease subunit